MGRTHLMCTFFPSVDAPDSMSPSFIVGFTFTGKQISDTISCSSARRGVCHRPAQTGARIGYLSFHSFFCLRRYLLPVPPMHCCVLDVLLIQLGICSLSSISLQQLSLASFQPRFGMLAAAGWSPCARCHDRLLPAKSPLPLASTRQMLVSPC